jgi:hypothetical protein
MIEPKVGPWTDPERLTNLVRELRIPYAQDWRGHALERVFAGLDDERLRAAEEIMRLRRDNANLRRKRRMKETT